MVGGFSHKDATKILILTYGVNRFLKVTILNY